MTSRIDKAARAIYAEAEKQDYVSFYGCHDGDTTLDGRFDLKSFVRAVLTAIRTPNEAMLKAMYEDAEAPIGSSYIAAAWQTAIDAILKEGT